MTEPRTRGNRPLVRTRCRVEDEDMSERAGYRPLAGIRVVELAQNLAGPYCGHILAELGADVIKVERPPGGDAARSWGPPFIDGVGSIFAAANRGKRSITLDVTSEAGRRVLQELVAHGDVLIEAFRPGTFAGMGYAYETVSSWNERIIYCSVLAYGETGPLRELPGYDPLMQAHGGIMSVTGAADGGPVRVGTSIVDMGTGMWLTIAVLAALRERDRTGAGTRLSVALYDTALAWNAYHLMGYVATGFVPAPAGTELPMIAPYGAFPTSDGALMLAPANDGLFVRLCHALGADTLSEDERFRTNPARVAHRTELNARIAAATRVHRTMALLEHLRAAGVPCAPIQDVAQVAADPQTQASGMLTAEDGRAAVPLPIRWNGTRSVAAGAPPGPGEHTRSVLVELGLDVPPDA
jgi:crotonobetainyl-CoA:carnitine CoA-transferase CaiB-like acyl-CoA transferase